MFVGTFLLYFLGHCVGRLNCCRGGTNNNEGDEWRLKNPFSHASHRRQDDMKEKEGKVGDAAGSLDHKMGPTLDTE